MRHKSPQLDYGACHRSVTAPVENAACCNQQRWATLILPNAEVGKVMQIRQERQLNAIADEVLALTAVVRPILTGVLYALKDDIVRQAGGRANISLAMLARLYRAGDGDCGICFEYAVHDAMRRGDPRVIERVNDAIHYAGSMGMIRDLFCLV